MHTSPSSVLVHELARALGLAYEDIPRSECETIVETVAMIVLAELGLDTAKFSVPYIAQWACNEKGWRPSSASQNASTRPLGDSTTALEIGS
jgi:hypothetical protein